MSTIGLDIGTTGCKAIVFDEEGHILGQGAREYPVLTPHPNWAEQDAEAVWQLAWDALSEAVAAAQDDPPVAMALSVQGEAVIPVDGDCQPLRTAILGMDTRTGAENDWLAERFGAEALFSRTGMPIHTVNTLPKLLWLQRNEPGVWRTADQFLLYEDFFLRHLGGRATISHCLASRTQMYDLTANDWADDILDGCSIDRGRLAPLAPGGGGIVGTLRRDLVGALGLSQEVLLVSGGHDQACASLGSGVAEAGLAMVSTGTAEIIEVAMDTPALNETLRQGDAQPPGGVAAALVPRHAVPVGDRAGPRHRGGRVRPDPGRRARGADGHPGVAPLLRQRHTFVRHHLEGGHPGPDVCHHPRDDREGDPGGPDVRAAGQRGPVAGGGGHD